MKPDNDKYQPISCELHSQYELAIMHKNKLSLTLRTDNSNSSNKIVTPTNIETKDKAEYLIIADGNKNSRIRLDHILKMRILDEN